MGLTGATNEERIWNYLVGKGLSKAGAAGLMGNLYAESALNPKNLQNSYEKGLGHTDESYTAAVDDGTYTNFVHDSAGYGLAQWTFWSRKQNMLAFARAAGRSIGDLEMQLDFLFKELAEGYKGVLATLKAATTVKAASDSVLLNFERPADQSSAAKTRRASYGQTYYDKYAGKASGPDKGGSSMTEQALRQKLVGIAQGWLGRKESDGSHREIIDLYNSHKPLARGYPVKYTDAWCSTFASAVAIKAGLTDIIPTECGCEKHIQLFKALGSWEENDAHVPAPGDYIFYDWDDNGAGDCTGSADHIGIVEKVSGQTITVIEGNMSNAVGRRTLKVNGRYIRGYGVPKYSSKATAGGNASGGAATPSPAPGPAASGLKVGDTVDFTGSRHYASADAANGHACKPGKAKVTQVYRPGQSKHPYHLVAVAGGGSNVYGWVDAADVSGKASSAATRTYTVRSGDSLWAIAAKQLGNGSRYKEIKSLNGLSNDTIHPGQVLKLPE